MKAVTIASLFGVALLAVLAAPIFAAPTPEALADPEPHAMAAPKPIPQSNCLLQSYGVDPAEMGSLLNVMLDLSINLLENKDDPCKKQEIMKKMKKARGDMDEYMKKQSGEGQGLLTGLLGPLLSAVDQLLEGLLGSEGVLGAVGDLLSNVINILLCLLKSLGLNVDIKLMVRLGNLLNLDLGVLLNLG